jgi:D-glycero-D-manno-heptose 1,7-bisphosphate phosphatase
VHKLSMEVNKAVFIDKDGTIIPDIPYNVDPKLIQLSDNAAEGLKELSDAGYKIIIISNQSGVARGFFDISALEAVQERIKTLLAEIDVVLTGFYICPHHPEGIIAPYNINCTCRKPANGMILQAAKEHHINLSQSWMVGDILNDVEAGNKAGCKTVLINNGNETEWVTNENRKATLIVSNINEAATSILHFQTSTDR